MKTLTLALLLSFAGFADETPSPCRFEVRDSVLNECCNAKPGGTFRACKPYSQGFLALCKRVDMECAAVGTSCGAQRYGAIKHHGRWYLLDTQSTPPFAMIDPSFADVKEPPIEALCALLKSYGEIKDGLLGRTCQCKSTGSSAKVFVYENIPGLLEHRLSKYCASQVLGRLGKTRAECETCCDEHVQPSDLVAQKWTKACKAACAAAPEESRCADLGLEKQSCARCCESFSALDLGDKNFKTSCLARCSEPSSSSKKGKPQCLACLYDSENDSKAKFLRCLDAKVAKGILAKADADACKTKHEPQFGHF